VNFEFSKEWWLRMALIEGDDEIGAGQIAVDPTFDGEAFSALLHRPDTRLIT
jgi:hypothetical protein